MRMVTNGAQVGERRWPMAAAVLVAGGLRIFLPSQLRLDDARPLLVVVLAVLMVALIVGDPGRIDRKKTWLRDHRRQRGGIGSAGIRHRPVRALHQ